MPINLIRWHYLGYVAAALAIMIAAIATHYLWFLNLIHVFCGLLWTGIDLFIGFVLGPILRVVDLAARKAVLLRLTPRTLFLMPTLAIITGTTGWYLAEDMGFNAISWPQYAWVAASLALVILMTIQGIGYLLPTNFRVCLELQKDNPDNAKIASLTNRYFFAVALQGVMQIVTILSWRDSRQESDDNAIEDHAILHDAARCRYFWRDDERSGLRSTKAPGNVRIMYFFRWSLSSRLRQVTSSTELGNGKRNISKMAGRARVPFRSA